MYARRLTAAAAATADAGLAGLVITPGYDLRYLVGSRAQTFERLTALVLPAAGQPTIVVPRLELASLNESAITELGLTVRDWVDGDDPYRLVGDALGGAPAVAAVTDSMPALHLLPLAGVLGAPPVLATDVMRGLRMVKQPAEIDALRKAGAAIDRVHARVPEFLIPGRTEAVTSPPISLQRSSPKDIRRWHSSSSGPDRTGPTRITGTRTANCRSATSSSSTSVAATNPGITPTPPALTASANPVTV